MSRKARTKSRSWAGSIGKIALVFLLAGALTVVLMVPVVLLAVYNVANEGLVDSAGRTFADWDAETVISVVWNHRVFYYGSTVAQAIGFVAAVWLVHARSDRRDGWRLSGGEGRESRSGRLHRAKPPGAAATLAAGLMSGTVLVAALAAAMWLLPGAMTMATDVDGEIPSRPFGNAAAWTTAAAQLALFVLVSLNEVVFVQGYAQGLLRHRHGRTAGLAGAVLLFTLLHGLNPGLLAHAALPLANTALLALLLAAAREASGGIWQPVGLHLAWSYVQGCVLGVPVAGFTAPSLLRLELPAAPGLELWTGGAFGPQGSLPATAVLLAACWWQLRRLRRKRAAAVYPNPYQEHATR
ncbi:CPBP family glutamic-type intramembrane protease [Paenibacillus koleovorans]|uniref:CPBP family glutamic-type intramembrane protease n=1 Tax=Paenibacillus koleovorans TaxID=121608 RepID=UPI0013E40902|nr:CPBP family glutamic-type intramembrane protease [Paenibacillus koleovorans]